METESKIVQKKEQKHKNLFSIYQACGSNVTADEFLSMIKRSKYLKKDLIKTQMSYQKYETFINELKSLPLSIEKKRYILEAIESKQKALRGSLNYELKSVSGAFYHTRKVYSFIILKT